MYSKEQQLNQFKKTKKKRCRECKKLFVPTREMQSCCGYECEINYISKPKNLKNAIKQGKEKRKKELAEKYPDKRALRKRIQAIANKYGRLMDYQRYMQEGCITCGKTGGKVDGGHFLPTSTYPSIRYYSKQIKCQCIKCNQFQGGMPKEYDIKMRSIYGDDFVDNLRLEHRKSTNYSVEYMRKYIRVINKRNKKLELRLDII